MKRFFRNMKEFPHKKDIYVKEFDDFYFRARPRYSSKFIRIFLEVRYSKITFLGELEI